jgi:hypothetical protein
MAKIVLIACSKHKADHSCKASELYSSPLFKLSLAYAHKLQPEQIFILSAKHGLVGLKDTLSPYDKTLHGLPRSAQLKWSNQVFTQLSQRTNPAQDTYIFLTGKLYQQDLLPLLPKHQLPLEGLGLGKRLAFLKNHL